MRPCCGWASATSRRLPGLDVVSSRGGRDADPCRLSPSLAPGDARHRAHHRQRRPTPAGARRRDPRLADESRVRRGDDHRPVRRTSEQFHREFKTDLYIERTALGGVRAPMRGSSPPPYSPTTSCAESGRTDCSAPGPTTPSGQASTQPYRHAGVDVPGRATDPYGGGRRLELAFARAALGRRALPAPLRPTRRLPSGPGPGMQVPRPGAADPYCPAPRKTRPAGRGGPIQGTLKNSRCPPRGKEAPPFPVAQATETEAKRKPHFRVASRKIARMANFSSFPTGPPRRRRLVSSPGQYPRHRPALHAAKHNRLAIQFTD